MMSPPRPGCDNLSGKRTYAECLSRRPDRSHGNGGEVVAAHYRLSAPEKSGVCRTRHHPCGGALYPPPVRMRAAAGQYETKGKEVVNMNDTIFWQWGGAF